MTPQGQSFEVLFWAMVFGPAVLLAVVAAFTRRSWLIWGIGALLATLITLLLADELGATYWSGLADRGYSLSSIAAFRAAGAAGAVTLVLIVLMALTRVRPAREPVQRQEPTSAATEIGVSGKAEISRVPAEVFATLLTEEQLDAAVEADAEGDRVRVQRRGGGILGHLPRLQATEVAMLARKGGRLKFWVTECSPGADGETGRVQVAYEESSRGARIPVEAAASTAEPAIIPASRGEALGLASPLPARQTGSAAVPTRSAEADVASQLATLASLKASGALSEVEFDAAKRRVLQI